MRPTRALLVPILIVACGSVAARDELDLDSAPPLAAEPGLRIGSVDDPDIGFSRPYMADVDRDGNLYVFEGMDLQIRVYSPEGELLRRFGGPGEGPGEFQGVSGFGVVGDTVWVVEAFNRRVTLFSRDGTVISATRAVDVRVATPGGHGYVLPTRLRPDGRFIGEMGLITYNPSGTPSDLAEGDSMPTPRVLFSADGQNADTVGWDPSPPPRMVPPPGSAEGRFQMIDVGGRRHMVPDPPSTLPDWKVASDGRFVVEVPAQDPEGRGAITVTKLDLAGDTVYSRRLEYSPIEYTAADLDSIALQGSRGPMMMGASMPEPDPAVAARLRAEMRFPRFRPPVSWSWVDQDDRLWLTLDRPVDEPATWIPLDEEGNPRGRLELPPRTHIVWSRGDELWAMQFDEMDVPWLVHYTIRSMEHTR